VPIGDLDCTGCGARLDPASFAPVLSRCLSCGAERAVPPPAGAETHAVELGWRALFRGASWRDALLARARGGGVILGKCDGCAGPRVAPPGTELAARCAHCATDARYALHEHVPDAMPLSRLRAWDMDLAWTPAHVHAQADAGLPCPICGAPLPAFTGTHGCAHCNVPLLALTSCGRRFVPGVRITGTDGSTTTDAWWPLAAALDHYRRRLDIADIGARGTKRTLLVWLLLFLAMPLVFCGLVGVAASFLDRIGPGGFMAVFVIVMLALMGAWIAVLLTPVIQTHKRRAEIRAIEAELARTWRPR
jgi:hypothetical protein